MTLGLRHGEILGLQWQDMNLDAGELHVRRAISTDAKGASRVTKPKTKSSARTLYLTPFRARVMTCSMAPREQKMETVWLDTVSITVEADEPSSVSFTAGPNGISMISSGVRTRN
ncbi:hypothetical protein GCM10008956_05320 [Deinococcus arenae]|uniref:Tyr recombinase domain-containing protein n=1 Tax=Deinococcus arenae TaxID=1452751 RepID=A0A8H9GJE7_9DEIO|nr:hypothetical protein DM785_09440 [Deinococcus actinosclerus]GGM32074.1 hypothetical protein GCM10008956_05320 [Deinococcus arenae]